MSVYFTAVTGWVLMVLLATTVGLPFWLRGGPPVASGSVRASVVERLRPHFWLGFSIAPLTFVHLWPAMSEGWVWRVDTLGLYLASLALLFTIGQVLLGSRLRDARGGSRRWLRRVHFWTMAGIAVLAVGHVVLNGAAWRAFFE